MPYFQALLSNLQVRIRPDWSDLVRFVHSFRFVSFILCRFSLIAFRIFLSLLVVHYFIHSFEIAFDLVSFSHSSFCPRTFSLNYFSSWARQAAASRSLHISQCVILIVIVTWASCTCVCVCVISALYWVWVLGMQVGLFEDHANCQSWAYKFVDWAYLSSAPDWMQRGYPQASKLQLQCVNLQQSNKSSMDCLWSNLCTPRAIELLAKDEIFSFS